MKQNIKMKLTLAAAALALGGVTIASAQQAATTPAPTAPEVAGSGLLGTSYIGAAYDYTSISGTGPNHAHGFDVGFNQPLAPHFDLNVDYGWAEARFNGVRLTDQDVNADLTAYTNLSWGKPFVHAAAGWDWVHGGGASDHSFQYATGVGVEIPTTLPFVVTPYVNFARATGYNQNEFQYGVKAEYRVTRAVGVVARVQYDAIHAASDQTEYSLGLNYHF